MFLDLQPHQEAMLRNFIQSRIIAGATDRRKVLFADNDPLKRRVFRSALDRCGYTVIEAADGLEALGLLQEHVFDLVILDIYLHELSGFNVITCIRKSPEWKKIPVIVLSSKSIPYDLKKAKLLGANAVLIKAATTPILLVGAAKRCLAGP
jgi:CheY-like chemotaxis protein